jgi:short-subunit dehydrogenase
MKDFFTIENLKKVKKNSYKILGDTAIITGGCGRIGSVFTSIFLSYGLKVIILSRTNNDYLNYKSILSASLKKNITWLKFDLTKPKSIDMVENWLKKKKYTAKLFSK